MEKTYEYRENVIIKNERTEESTPFFKRPYHFGQYKSFLSDLLNMLNNEITEMVDPLMSKVADHILFAAREM